MERENRQDGDNEPSLTEPVAIPDTFLTGAYVEVGDDFVRIVAWSQLPQLGGEMNERRIVARIVMPKAVGRDIATQLRKGLSIKHNVSEHH